MTLLVSHPETGVLERLEDEHGFPIHDAIQTVRKTEIQRLLVPEQGRQQFKQGWLDFEAIAKWHDDYSHASLFALASQRRFDQPGTRFMGSGLDEGKLGVCRMQLRLRISAA